MNRKLTPETSSINRFRFARPANYLLYGSSGTGTKVCGDRNDQADQHGVLVSNQ